MARVIYMRVTIEFYLTKGLMYYGEHYAVDIPYCDSRYICGSYYRSAEKTRQENTPDAGSIKAGDTIKTIGGIYGKVVSVKEDLVVIETGPENARITFAKGAVATVEAATASNEDSGEKVEKAAEADAEKK